MSEELFSIPEQPLSELAQARIRFDAARETYGKDPLSTHGCSEYVRAKAELERAEHRELERMKRA